MVPDVTVKRAELPALQGSLYQRSVIMIWQRTNHSTRWRLMSRSSTPHHFPGLIIQCTLWTNLVGIHTFTSCVPKTRRKVAGSWRSFWAMSGASVGALDESGLTLGVNTSITPPPKASWNSSCCFLNLKKFVSARTSPSRKHQRMDRRSTELSNDFTARLVKWRMHFCIMAGCPLFFGNLHIVIRTGCITD